MSDRDEQAPASEPRDDAELDRMLGRVRADVPADEDALDRGRATVLAAAAELERADGTVVAGPGTLIRVVPADPEAEPETAGRPRRRRAASLAAVAAAVVVAVALAVAQLPSTEEPGIDTAAAEVLERVAETTSRTGDVPIEPGQYRYTEMLTWRPGTGRTQNGQDVEYRSEVLTRTWVPSDERQEWLQRDNFTGKREIVSGGEEALEIALATEREMDGREVRGRCGDYPDGRTTQPCERYGQVDWSNPTLAWMSSLPTEPAELAERLREDSLSSFADRDYQRLTDATLLLRTGRLPAAQRAALYRVLASVPGLQTAEPQTAPNGRAGIVLSVPAPGAKRCEIIIDPETGEYVGDRVVDLAGGEAGTPGGAVAFHAVRFGVADRIGVEPGG
ncbi:hypothetical protein CFN78_20500 [Amycolatopsis antarctica]|uniref:CU044_5270 family protein n=1 Tax=Amycolatopsis antarctica TaxID=1854586 RepID=A0A263CZC9_9PSEU|nr:CU044_5270 family protein [Amycolatopsis antarctica]OZM71522.1 hypothetical protein CFN78_20500 [Amycolatopsis antarctica]